MELKDTIVLMESENYKDRFQAEYYQTKIRYNKLHAMTVKYEDSIIKLQASLREVKAGKSLPCCLQQS